MMTVPLRAPDLILRAPGVRIPYLTRWHLVPRNRFFNIYLHRFDNDDPGQDLHDHPWWNVSIVLRGQYVEHYVRRPYDIDVPGRHRAASSHWLIPRFRRSDMPHRLTVKRGPVWTLFVTGPRRRHWGFWCGGTWVRHDEYEGCRVEKPRPTTEEATA